VALTARRVDLRRRRIEVVEAITEVHGRVIIGTTKTHQRRSVPIPRFLADKLAAQLAGKAPSDLVFAAPKGGVLRNTNFRPRFFDPAAGRAGLPGLTPLSRPGAQVRRRSNRPGGLHRHPRPVRGDLPSAPRSRATR
jgi:integrase